MLLRSKMVLGCLAVLVATTAGFLWQNPTAAIRPGLEAELARQLVEEWLRAALVGIVLGGLATYLVSGLLAEPLTARLDRLTKALMRARKGELEARLEDPTGDEVAAVGEAFNLLIASLGDQLEKATGETVDQQTARVGRMLMRSDPSNGVGSD